MRTLFIIALSLLSTNAMAWKLVSGIDKMTDKKEATLVEFSKDAVWANKKAELYIFRECDSAVEHLALIHPYLVSGEDTTVRIDKSQPFDVESHASKDRSVLSIGKISSHEDGDGELIDKISAGKNLIVKYKDLAGTTYIAEFSVSNLAAKRKSACK